MTIEAISKDIIELLIDGKYCVSAKSTSVSFGTMGMNEQTILDFLMSVEDVFETELPDNLFSKQTTADDVDVALLELLET